LPVIDISLKDMSELHIEGGGKCCSELGQAFRMVIEGLVHCIDMRERKKQEEKTERKRGVRLT
jgi:hypothetical protein